MFSREPEDVAKKILGNLTNHGKAKEMIAVMPYIFCASEWEECAGMTLQNSLCYKRNFLIGKSSVD